MSSAALPGCPKAVFADQPGRPKPIIDSAPPQPVPVAAAASAPAAVVAPVLPQSAPTPPVATAPRETGSGTSAIHGTEPGPFEKAAASLIEASVAFLEAIAASAGNSRSARAGDAQHPLSKLFSQDPKTNRPHLSIPLPSSVTEERLTIAVSGLLGALQA